MGFTRGSLTLPRMNAHRLVIIAAALTTVVAAALATALATFGGQALPRAVRDDLTSASGTTMVITGQVTAAQAAQYSATLPRQVSAALGGAPFGFYRADWSDPLGFVPGSLPASPASAGNTPIAEAAALADVSAHATLVSGHWPGRPGPGGQPIPAALPATAAALMHVSTGDVLRLKDRVSGHVIRFVVTGLYRPRAGVRRLGRVLEPGRRGAVGLDDGQRLHHLRPADRAGVGVRLGRGADRGRGLLAGPAADRRASRLPSSPRSRRT